VLNPLERNDTTATIPQTWPDFSEISGYPEVEAQRFVRDGGDVTVSVEPIASTILNFSAVAPRTMTARSVSSTGP
jgi:hypothetical protein